MDNVSEYFLESISIYTTHRGICTCLMNSGDCAHREGKFTAHYYTRDRKSELTKTIWSMLFIKVNRCVMYKCTEREGLWTSWQFVADKAGHTNVPRMVKWVETVYWCLHSLVSQLLQETSVKLIRDSRPGIRARRDWNFRSVTNRNFVELCILGNKAAALAGVIILQF